MAHYAKYQADGSLRLIDHDKREKTHLQEHIDTGRSYLNYNLAPHHDDERKFFLTRKKEALETGSRFNKRSVALVSCVITLPKDFPFKDDPEKVKAFFEECVKYLHKKHGEKNCVSAWVHLDETSPHLHYKSMPLVWQKDKDGKDILQFNAKKILTRSYLQKFHSDLEKHLTVFFGEPIHLLNESTSQGNLSPEQMKQNSKVLHEQVSLIDESFQKEKEDISQALTRLEEALNHHIDVKPLKVKKDRVVLDFEAYNALTKDMLSSEAKEAVSSLLRDLRNTLRVAAFGYMYEEKLNENEALCEELQKYRKHFREAVEKEVALCVSDVLEANKLLTAENDRLLSKNRKLDAENSLYYDFIEKAQNIFLYDENQERKSIFDFIQNYDEKKRSHSSMHDHEER